MDGRPGVAQPGLSRRPHRQGSGGRPSGGRTEEAEGRLARRSLGEGGRQETEEDGDAGHASVTTTAKWENTSVGDDDGRAEPEGRPAIDTLCDRLREMEANRTRGTLALPDGARVPVGNLHKVFWPEPGADQGDLVRFNLRMSPYLLPSSPTARWS